ncbi:MAG: chromosomal replication initiator protein DnaA [Myxococcales bacterium]|nr:chromosomal replication initiator protein DnaA [Myxococcales bacterium]
MNDTHSIWFDALQRVQTRVSPQNFDMWIRPLECVDVGAEIVKLRAPNAYIRLWFETNFLPEVVAELVSVAGRPISVEFASDAPEGAILRRSPASPVGDTDVAFATAGKAPDVPAGAPAIVNSDAGEGYGRVGSLEAGAAATAAANLNPRYVFESFVSGPSNQLAFAAAQSAAASYPPKYNPVFLCGGVGLGKTHLLHAIGHVHATDRPGTRIHYTTGERFMNEYVSGVQTRSMNAFRKRYREDIDVLLVDDVQFLAGKEGTQDEFFHTFNALYETHKQIVLTSDRKPHEISDIADRLRTRFAWGLLADIEPPELEVRLAILRKKAASEGIALPDDVAMLVATAVKSNVRELEGALIRLAAYSSLSKRVIDVEFARETLGPAFMRPREHLAVETIIKAVATYYGVRAADLKGERRHKSIAAPRAVAMYLARQHTQESYPDLGRAFGGKHHTTIISAVEKIAVKLAADVTLRGEIMAIESTLPK